VQIFHCIALYCTTVTGAPIFNLKDTRNPAVARIADRTGYQ